jgi:anthranilate synthase component 1
MKVTPSYEEFEKLCKEGFNVIPLSVELLGDSFTPVSCYANLKNGSEQAFLLESVDGGERIGRYSIIGVNGEAYFTVKGSQLKVTSARKNNPLAELPSDDAFAVLKSLLTKFKSPQLLDCGMGPGLVGGISYDTVRLFEPVDLKPSEEFPDASFVLLGDLVVFDNLKKSLRAVSNVYVDSFNDLETAYEEGIERIKHLLSKLENTNASSVGALIPTEILQGQENKERWKSSFTKELYKESVKKAKERILAGDIFQLVLSQGLKLDLRTIDPHLKIDPLLLYRMLRTLNPSPYLFLLDFPDFQAIGSSPEVMVKSEFVKEDNNFLAYLRPIAGTYRRGATPKDDEELIKKLKEDPKELAEHLMLIDLARNDLGRVAIPGTVRLTDLMIVERYSHVLHLVSEIVANLDKKIDPIDLLKAVFPAGTLSGAPKVKAMQIISELEPTARGLYAGAIGYIGFDNTINMAMTIRTLIMKDQTIHLQVGAGIVHDSDPEKEFQETINKGAALLKVVEGAIILSSKN